eukprot:g12800.t1
MALAEPLLKAEHADADASPYWADEGVREVSCASTADTVSEERARADALGVGGKNSGNLLHSIDDKVEVDNAPMHPSLPPLGSPQRAPLSPGRCMEDNNLMTGAEATFTVVNFTMNVGLLTLPCLFARHGWSAGILMAFAGASCACTALFLQNSLVTLVRTDAKEALKNTSNFVGKQVRGIPLPDFPDLAREAIGARFAVIAHVVAQIEIVGYMCCNLIALANGLAATAPSLTEPQAMIISSGIWLPLKTRLFVAERFQVALAAISDRLFAYCALMSTTSMVAIFASLLLWGTEFETWAQPSTLVSDVSYMPASFAVIIFTAGAHPLIPCVMHSTRSRHEYRSALRLSWTFFSIFAIVAGGMAFYMYGHSLRPLITDTQLAWVFFPGGGAMRKTGGIWVLVKLFGSVIPSSRPTVRLLGKQSLDGETEGIGVDLPAGNGGFKSVLVTAPLLCAVAGVSQLLSPYVAAFESAIGCVITSFNALFFPSLTYLAICQPKDIKLRLCAGFFVLVGAALPIATFLPQVLPLAYKL